MRVQLVTMPWAALHTPSMPLGVLTACAERTRNPQDVTTYFGNLRWAEWLLEHTGGRVTPVEYSRFCDEHYNEGIGDWIFSAAMHGVGEWRIAEFRESIKRFGVDPGLPVELHRLAPGFADEVAAEIAALRPGLVGFTSTFLQNCASLAVARRLKERLPGVRIALGGPNCDGPQGAALHRNYLDVDFVVGGEAEDAFVALLDALDGVGDLAAVPGLYWRDDEGNPRANPRRPALLPMDAVPAPDYDPYFRRLADSPLREWLEPSLLIETSRGCWWGEKHHCTFCGVNGMAMPFRSKPGKRAHAELAALTARHHVLDVIAVDNILDMRYFTDFLPTVAAEGWDLRIHYEVKANLRTDQVAALAAAGVVHIQPGIEGLNSRVLDLMDKGVTGAQNVRLLRDCAAHGITVTWNHLCGFPGETGADYADVEAQLSALVHLHPPMSLSRVAIERFSPYFDRPELGFPDPRPAWFYPLVYDLPEEELADLAYLFAAPDRGIDRADEARIWAGLERWCELFPGSTLTERDLGDTIVIDDRRRGRTAAEHVLHDPHDLALYRALASPRTAKGLAAHAAEQHGVAVSEEETAGWLAGMRERGLVFQDAERFVTLAIPAGAPAPRTRATRFGRLSLDPGDPLAALEALRFLRDATAERRPVEWRLGEGWTEELMAALVHLVPPVDGPQRWRERHRFGMLYWRAGPGFATVKDTRGEPAGWGRYLLDDAASLEAFRDLRRPRPITEAARPLIDAGLVLDLGGLGLALPYRIRRWPIPSDSI